MLDQLNQKDNDSMSMVFLSIDEALSLLTIFKKIVDITNQIEILDFCIDLVTFIGEICNSINDFDYKLFINENRQLSICSTKDKLYYQIVVVQLLYLVNILGLKNSDDDLIVQNVTNSLKLALIYLVCQLISATKISLHFQKFNKNEILDQTNPKNEYLPHIVYSCGRKIFNDSSCCHRVITNNYMIELVNDKDSDMISSFINSIITIIHEWNINITNISETNAILFIKCLPIFVSYFDLYTKLIHGHESYLTQLFLKFSPIDYMDKFFAIIGWSNNLKNNYIKPPLFLINCKNLTNTYLMEVLSLNVVETIQADNLEFVTLVRNCQIAWVIVVRETIIQKYINNTELLNKVIVKNIFNYSTKFQQLPINISGSNYDKLQLCHQENECCKNSRILLIALINFVNQNIGKENDKDTIANQLFDYITSQCNLLFSSCILDYPKLDCYKHIDHEKLMCTPVLKKFLESIKII